MLRDYIKQYREHEGIFVDAPLEEIDFIRAMQWSAWSAGEGKRQGVEDYKDLVVNTDMARLYYHNFDYVVKNGLGQWVKEA